MRVHTSNSHSLQRSPSPRIIFDLEKGQIKPGQNDNDDITEDTEESSQSPLSFLDCAAWARALLYPELEQENDDDDDDEDDSNVSSTSTLSTHTPVHAGATSAVVRQTLGTRRDCKLLETAQLHRQLAAAMKKKQPRQESWWKRRYSPEPTLYSL